MVLINSVALGKTTVDLCGEIDLFVHSYWSRKGLGQTPRGFIQKVLAVPCILAFICSKCELLHEIALSSGRHFGEIAMDLKL